MKQTEDLDISKPVFVYCLSGYYAKGKYSVPFNGNVFTSGLYFYKISAKGTTDEFSDSKKMELIK